MRSFIDKVLEIFTIKPRKITQFLIILFTFTLLFQKQAISLYELITGKLHIIFADSFIDTLSKIHLSNDEVITIWSFILYLFIITVILDSINQLLHNDTPIILGSGADFLLEVNSILLLLIAIYNQINEPKITLPFSKSDSLYLVIFQCLLILYIGIFCATYFYNPFSIYSKIQNKRLAFTYQVALNILNIVIYITISGMFLQFFI